MADSKSQAKAAYTDAMDVARKALAVAAEAMADANIKAIRARHEGSISDEMQEETWIDVQLLNSMTDAATIRMFNSIK